jgi:hypothetical protein
MAKNEMILSAKNVFINLMGAWNFSRSINDYQNKTEIPATGIVEFTSINENKSLYKEEGSLLINGKKISFTRKYYYCLAEELIKIYFADGANYGSLFQTLDINFKEIPAMAKGSHLCINDLYQGVFHFYHENKFKNSFKIKGPHKDQLIDTVFERQGGR